MAKSPNKFNSRTCRENLTTATGSKIKIKQTKILAWKLIHGNDTQFAAIFIRENICVYGMSIITKGYLTIKKTKHVPTKNLL
jgi:hypothetical protein